MNRKSKQRSNVIKLFGGEISLPEADNTSQALKIYRAANERFRQTAWPAPFDKTLHLLRQGDARDLSALPDKSVHLIVTSPPYWNLKKYAGSKGQLGDLDDYDPF